MDINRDYHLRQTADTLCELADIVEHSGLCAGDIGRMLCDAYERSSLDFSAEVHRDLRELRSSPTSPAKFAAGLRRQADFLRAQAASEIPTP